MKKFKEILGDMVIWMRMNSKVSNFNVGSVVRSILEAVAMEIEEIYAFIRKKFAEMQENSIYLSFGFPKASAIAATGNVTVKFTQTLAQSVLFEKGYKFYTAPIDGKTIYFESTKDVTALIGTSEILIPVKCTEAGTVGNVPSFSITKTVTPKAFIAGVYNSDKFFSGMPEETKEERQKRFNAFIQSLGKGTQDAVTYGCLQVEGVTGVYISEDIGMIYIYAHDAYGEMSPELKLAIERQLYYYKAGGVKAIVSGVVKKPVDIELEVLINSNYSKDSVLFLVNEAVQVYLNRMTVSKPLILADFIHYLMDIDREAIVNITLNIDSDIILQPQELIRPGTVVVTGMG